MNRNFLLVGAGMTAVALACAATLATRLPSRNEARVAVRVAGPSAPAPVVDPGIVTVSVCADSGEVATAYCPETELRQFRAGSQPTKVCPVHSGR